MNTPTATPRPIRNLVCPLSAARFLRSGISTVRHVAASRIVRSPLDVDGAATCAEATTDRIAAKDESHPELKCASRHSSAIATTRRRCHSGKASSPAGRRDARGLRWRISSCVTAATKTRPRNCVSPCRTIPTRAPGWGRSYSCGVISKKASACSRRSLQANPSAPNRAPECLLLAKGHRGLAERALAQQHPALAADEARKSVELDGTSADAHNILGAALASTGNLAAAIPEFQAAVRIDPKHPSAVNNLARATALAGSRR
jgi:tetratricopeptide (TPR) repeat protein